MKRSAFLTLGLLILVPAVVLSAGSRVPVAVSPGAGVGVQNVADTCTTFSWAGVGEAKSYTLAVYEVTEGGQLGWHIIRQVLPAGAFSWTIPADHCLSLGKTYAWTVGAIGRGAGTIWSEPVLFRVALGPTEAEFERSLTVVQKYLAAKEGLTPEAEREGEVGGSPEAGAVRKMSEESSTPHALGGSDFSVDSNGNVQAASFAGDGFQLSRVNAATLQGLSASTFLRNSSDSFDGGILTFKIGTTLDMNGALRMDGTVVKTGTGRVENFNADLLDGFHGSAFAKASDVPEIQAGSTMSASLCPTTTLTGFSPVFSSVPAVVISPEGASGFPDSTVGNSYCVIHEIDAIGFRHCCYGDDPQELHWIAIGD